MNRPFDGGFEATSGISIVIYFHVLLEKLSLGVSQGGKPKLVLFEACTDESKVLQTRMNLTSTKILKLLCISQILVPPMHIAK